MLSLITIAKTKCDNVKKRNDNYSYINTKQKVIFTIK